MEKRKLIQQRDFGEKSNEVTDFLIDNFPALRKWVLMFILPSALAYSILNIMLSDDDVVQWVIQFFTCILITIMCTMQTTVMAEHFTKDIPLKDIKWRQVLPQMLRNTGRVLLVLFVPILVWSIITFFINNLRGPHSGSAQYFFDIERAQLMILSLFLTSLCSLPLHHTINVVVIEGRTGMDALKRAFSITFHRFIFSALYIIAISLLGIILPELASLPFIALSFIDQNFITSFEIEDTETFINCLQCAFATLSNTTLAIQMMFASLAMMFDYGDVVDRHDLVTFREKVNNFENL